MAYLTESMLQDYAQDYQKKQYARNNIVLEKALAQKTIFLSHSHRDKSIVVGLINYLATLGILLYVDWNDTEMPRITDRATAEKIKVKIKENTFFLILATENAMSSRWVPWEIGVADQMKTIERIAILPVVRTSDTEFKGNEYLRLYKCIRLQNLNQIRIFEAASEYRYSDIGDWLRG
jgi:hypothetical protein